MTKQQAVEEHRKMWSWIAEETQKQQRCVGKAEYQMNCGRQSFDILNDCFCCQFSMDYPDDHAECERCPIEFDSTAHEYMCIYTSDDSMENKFSDGLYAAWEMDCESGDWEHAAEMAYIIAGLTERFW